jgi:hypothetical protein
MLIINYLPVWPMYIPQLPAKTTLMRVRGTLVECLVTEICRRSSERAFLGEMLKEDCNGRKMLTGEYRNAGRETWPSAILTMTDLAWTGLGSNPAMYCHWISLSGIGVIFNINLWCHFLMWELTVQKFGHFQNSSWNKILHFYYFISYHILFCIIYHVI